MVDRENMMRKVLKSSAAVIRVLMDQPGWAFVKSELKNREGKVAGRGYTFRL